jgi:crotonobetainyl-CoA:carnitine CoA-transferase CaiB-like acyl-CoA transferase
VHTRAALLPMTMAGQRLPLRSNPPSLGEHSLALLQQLGYDLAQIASWQAEGVFAMSAPEPRHPGDGPS